MVSKHFRAVDRIRRRAAALHFNPNRFLFEERKKAGSLHQIQHGHPHADVKARVSNISYPGLPLYSKPLLFSASSLAAANIRLSN